MNQKLFWEFALETICNNKRLVLLTVAESSNSSPGRKGFKMLLREDGVQQGTIGGGIMEKRLIDYSHALLNGSESTKIKKLQHSGETKLEKSGLICGGFQTILFSIIDADSVKIIKSIIRCIASRENGLLEQANGILYFYENKFQEKSIEFELSENDSFVYRENIGFSETAYIAGGGHVGLAVSRIMKTIGFYVVIFDHRKNIFTMDNNEYADEKIITEYKNINKYIKEGSKSYVVITTPMHMGDREALGSVLNMDLKYIGMMGSSKKIKATFNALLELGFTQEQLTKIHTPIGLEIYAETPEEIAISIASEIIKIKHSD